MLRNLGGYRYGWTWTAPRRWRQRAPPARHVPPPATPGSTPAGRGTTPLSAPPQRAHQSKLASSLSMSVWSIALAGSCGPCSSASSGGGVGQRRRAGAVRGRRSPKAAMMSRHLGLDRLQRRHHLGDALAGDVLEAACLVDARGGVLQLCRQARAASRPTVRRRRGPASRRFPGSLSVASAVCATMASSSSVAEGMWLALMSSTRNAAISALAAAMVRPSSATSPSSAVSVAVRSPLMVASTARTTSATASGAGSG